MENEKKIVEVKAEETKVQEQANVPAPQQETEEVKKPNIFKRGFGLVKRNGKTIAKGAGLVLAGVVAGAFVGALVSKRDEDGGCETSDDYSGDDYGWQPEPEDDQTELDNCSFDFSDEEADEEEAS